jgi:hypothetical protein
LNLVAMTLQPRGPRPSDVLRQIYSVPQLDQVINVDESTDVILIPLAHHQFIYPNTIDNPRKVVFKNCGVRECD